MVSFKNQLQLIKADMTISASVKSTLSLFYDRVLQQLKLGGLKGKARLSIIMKEMNKCIKFYPFISEWLYTIQIEGFGSFLELIFCGPGKIGFPPKPTMPMVSASPKPTCSCTCGSTFMP
uniref:Uncharacterized protein n=1 Tax=Panagrolaimus superbus TaxID=310955 RepID=A0A914YQJ0_9BILA